MKAELNNIKNNLGNNISIPLLLGGGDFSDEIKNKIHKCLIKFIKDSGRKIQLNNINQLNIGNLCVSIDYFVSFSLNTKLLYFYFIHV